VPGRAPTGIGTDSERAPALFKAFKQASAGANRAIGLGLTAFPLRMRRLSFQFSFCSGDYFPGPTPNVMSI
jgi:hypothetical protein